MDVSLSGQVIFEYPEKRLENYIFMTLRTPWTEIEEDVCRTLFGFEEFGEVSEVWLDGAGRRVPMLCSRCVPMFGTQNCRVKFLLSTWWTQGRWMTLPQSPADFTREVGWQPEKGPLELFRVDVEIDADCTTQDPPIALVETLLDSVVPVVEHEFPG
jgi:hypothetical protein